MRTNCLPRVCAPSLLVLALLLCGCDGSPSGASSSDSTADRVDEVAQRLQGTWLREFKEAGIQSRRILRLESDGAFRETVRIIDPAGVATEHLHEGTWLYDGTNLKRKYTTIDGHPPSRLNPPFVTFAIEFESRNEFVGIDHIHGNRIRYARVSPETTP